MRKVRAFITTILFVQSIAGQDIVFEHYGDTDGLSHNTVRSILQDKNGFLWLGTFGGVNRFDGHDFKVYHAQPDNPNYLRDDDITKLALDKNEKLWIGTSKGLTRFCLRSGSFTTFLPDSSNLNSISGSKVRAVFVDDRDRVWTGTKFKGLCYYDQSREQFIKMNIEDVQHVRAITQTRDKKMWIGTFKHGIYSFDIDSGNNLMNLKSYRLQYSDKESTVNPGVYFIYEDDKGDIFAGTQEGLGKLDRSSNSFELVEQKDPDFFRCITQGPDGKYWIGTQNGIITCDALEDIAEGRYKRHLPDMSNANSLVNNYISALFFDKSGVLWIGTENGLEKYDPFGNQFKLISERAFSTRVPPVVSSFGKTYDGELLIGTHFNGIYLTKGTKIKKIFDVEERIASIYSLDQKVFYIGMWDGKVYCYDHDLKIIKELRLGFENGPIFSFYQREPNKLWIGTKGKGLWQYDFGTKKCVPVAKESLGAQEINKIVGSRYGLLWIATENGVFRYDEINGQVKHYGYDENKADGLTNNKVKDISIDRDGRVWVATRHGLNFYDPQRDRFLAKDVPKELKNIWVTDMGIDSKGHIWLNMNYNQIAKYNPKTEDFRVFFVNNGVRSNIYNKRGFLFYDDSRIYLGGDNGVIYFSPSELSENHWAPQPLITEFKIAHRDVLPETVINGQKLLTEDLNYVKKIALDFDNRNFSLKFAMPSYVRERSNQYEYKLEGFDEDWIAVNSASRTVRYTNLYPDDYVFKVRAANSNGYWSNENSYSISIAPPFWLTYKALLVFLFFASVVFYFIRKEIKNRLRLKQELLMVKVKREHDEKLSNEKLRFFTNISHELRTPLTLILGPAKQMIEEGEEHGNTYQLTRSNLIYENANRLLGLVNQILDFRKVQTGELKLKVTQTDILLQTQNIFDSFKPLASGKRIHYNLSVEEEEIMGWVDHDKFDKILYNLLSNALKFTPNYGHVDVFIGLKDNLKGWLVVEVSDDGIGVPPESQRKIFRRFYQAANSRENNTGTGIGLALVKSLTELHKGTISLQSDNAKGSIFTLELPIARNLYRETEVFEYAAKSKKQESIQVQSAKKIIQGTHLKEKILVIEDNEELRSYLVDYLSDYYKVYSAENGEEGLTLCRQIRPVLCVADVMMPVMDGYRFCEALKNDEFISHIPIILLTALSENEDKIKGFNAGADGYLIKPFDPSLLKSRIENIMRTRLELKAKFSEEVESEVSLLTHSPVDEEFMEKVTTLVHENLNNPDLTTTFLCRELGMSSSKLYRKIKELTDLAPNEFIRTVRLKKSAQLLKTRKYNVSEVTDYIGFNDPLYFSRCFKKQFGFPPSKLIK
ncbi:two-component regulator propeller domain-containing protein [Flavobacteriaceae bacterium GF1]